MTSLQDASGSERVMLSECRSGGHARRAPTGHKPNSGQQLLPHPAVALDTDQPLLEAEVGIPERLRIEAQLVEDRRLEVMDRDRILGDGVPQVVGRAELKAALDAAA